MNNSTEINSSFFFMARGNISDFAGFITCIQARYEVHVKQDQEDWWPAPRDAF